MVEDRGNSKSAENLLTNLLDLNFKISHQLQENIVTVIPLLLDVTELTKYHYCFVLFFNPRYVMGLKYIKKFHQSENVDMKTLSSI